MIVTLVLLETSQKVVPYQLISAQKFGRFVIRNCFKCVRKGNQLGNFNGLFDLAEQAVIRRECKSTVDRLGNDSIEKLALVSDLEEIITFYSKSKKTAFRADNGWTDLLQLLSVLKLPKPQLYNCFNALVTRYIPKYVPVSVLQSVTFFVSQTLGDSQECHKDGRPFHLFRLLLLYHDPELCSILDTKKITPDLYALQWFQGLFSSICDIDVCLNMWDVYLQQADPFLVFFLGLVLLVNAKEQIEGLGMEDKDKIIETLKSAPAALEADDIEDFCSLAQYYASKTPQSFRRHYQSPLFGIHKSTGVPDGVQNLPESQALCLPVSIEELLHANELGAGEGVRYFVVDCRPADQYNAGHLPTAFHLDANLMLQNPAEFSTAIQALVATQKQALESGSSAAGEHLCFMGSGREEEDQYVHMVIANFLQKTTQYVSYARGGYSALHQALEDNLANGITDHNPQSCICCVSVPQDSGSTLPNSSSFASKTGNLFNKLSVFGSTMKNRAAETKEKLSNYIKNDFPPEERFVEFFSVCFSNLISS
ncbi:TBC1D23 [Bugula neritina]|uniref:TBC1 domain family member 23 n=1 Tax=Bugula neritina TaxID=10212 RepID=A0A7J7K1B8_BUGNE|nr:TBC1D23 [Bugula neritina]